MSAPWPTCCTPSSPPSIPLTSFPQSTVNHSRPIPSSEERAHPLRSPSFTDLPVWLKTSGKFIISLPFFFHSFNGIRHLTWDMGKGTPPLDIKPQTSYLFANFLLLSRTALSLKGVYSTGYAVLCATLVSSVAAAFFL